MAIWTNYLERAIMLQSRTRTNNVITVAHSVNAVKYQKTKCNIPTNHIHADYNYVISATLSQITSQGQGSNCVTGIIKRASLRNLVHNVVVDSAAERSPSCFRSIRARIRLTPKAARKAIVGNRTQQQWKPCAL